MDYVRYWTDRTEMSRQTLIHWIGISHSKFYDWQKSYGKINEHNHWIPRDFWLQDWEKETIVNYFLDHPGQGYRRLTVQTLLYYKFTFIQNLYHYTTVRLAD